MQNAFQTNIVNLWCFQNETLFNSQFIAMNSIPSPQTNLFSDNAKEGIMYTVQ